MYFVSGGGIGYQGTTGHQGQGFYVPSRLGSLMLLPTGRLLIEPRHSVLALVKETGQSRGCARLIMGQASLKKAELLAQATRDDWQTQKSGGHPRWPNAASVRICVEPDTPALRTHRFVVAPLRREIRVPIGCRLDHRAIGCEKEDNDRSLLFLRAWQDEFYPMAEPYSMRTLPDLANEAEVVNKLETRRMVDAVKPDLGMPKQNEYVLFALAIRFRVNDAIVIIRDQPGRLRRSRYSWDGECLTETCGTDAPTVLWDRAWID